ncbi:hypothetical protein BX281_0541 [Streptomyces sp. Ag82_O1-15]|uniref:hypothetical protein n=1 Tax=Streptomyces sp. Ag82_O1-15 TaxID=1938855 RepID=UPI000BCF1F72|nr:hypothetical protein BX281_0541 [Streptomyces sp. Ag82_O1-15]
MQCSHAPAVAFDDANLVAHAGLVPVMRLAERCGLARLTAQNVKLGGAKNRAGASADAKVTSLVASMAAGADSIDDLDVLRHGAMPSLFGGVRAPSTLGTFLRVFTHGHALHLHAVHRKCLAALARHTPLLPARARRRFKRELYGRSQPHDRRPNTADAICRPISGSPATAMPTPAA